MPSRREFLAMLAAAQDDELKSPADALNVLDFEAAARRTLPPAHFGYIQTGVDGDRTLAANTNAYERYALRARRLVDVSRVDLSVELFGRRWPAPILFQPCGSQKGFHPLGEVAVARAAKSRETLQVLSTASTTAVEEVIREAGYPVWYQLYATNRWETTVHLVRRAEKAGCEVLVLTVDLPTGRNTETQERFKRMDTRPCATCHGDYASTYFHRKPMFEGVDMAASGGIGGLFHPAMDWAFVDRLRGVTRMKLVLKGIVTAEDARLAVAHGVDGVVVSNHGGRAEESHRASLTALPEVAAAIGGRIPVILDGGIRRGTDIFKALALGATAVGVGRPYLWALAAFGQPGVERVVDLLRRELDLIMRQCGTRSLGEISRSLVEPSI